MLAFHSNVTSLFIMSNIKKIKIRVTKIIKTIDIFKVIIETKGQKILNKVVI
jgi:hypothetical protein